MWFLVILAILGCAVLFPRLAKVLLAMLAAGVVLVSALVLRNQEQERAARTRIPPREIQIAEAHLVSDGPGLYSLRGRVRNRSRQYAVSAVTLRVTLEDCDSNGECEIVAEHPASVAGTISPGQARDFHQGGIGSSDLHLKGSLHWGYEVTSVRAAE
jgi:hypothetical protein